MDGPTIILVLKLLVSAVTLLYAASLVMLARGQIRWHGRINTAFFILTMTTVLGFELLLRLGTDVTANFSPEARDALKIHLYFAIPSACLLPLMFYLGKKHKRSLHITLGLLFTGLWLGTFVTGVFYLPHR